ALDRLRVSGSEVGGDPNHRLQRHRTGDEVVGIAPGVAPGVFRRLEEVPDHPIELLRLTAIGACPLDAPPIRRNPAVDLVEELGLEDPFLLLAPTAESV